MTVLRYGHARPRVGPPWMGQIVCARPSPAVTTICAEEDKQKAVEGKMRVG